MNTELADAILQVDVTVLSFLAGTVIPLLTAVLTKVNASSGVKAITNLVLSLAAGGVAHLIAHDGKSTVLNLIAAMVAVYLASGVSYQNLWKPTGVSLKVATSTGNTGLGTARKPEQAQVAPDTDQV